MTTYEDHPANRLPDEERSKLQEKCPHDGRVWSTMLAKGCENKHYCETCGKVWWE